jgi:pyruvate/2-oxoglutarate dehydrogenase complex dihydrolipoamide dehydrogenase (E3) component
MAKSYDLVVIGTGTAAQVASSRVRAAGWSVAVIDFRPFGGTCALRGCDPKTMLVSGAETVDMVRQMRGRSVDGDVRIDWRDLMLRIRATESRYGTARSGTCEPFGQHWKRRPHRGTRIDKEA